MSVTMETIRAAHKTIASRVHRTPVLRCRTIEEMTGAELYFKCENFQKGGAFKSRGACNAVFSLSEREASLGVVTHSSGNHAAALARAARIRGIPAYIVMPENSSAAKVAAVEHYEGRITFCEPTLAAREATAAQIVADSGAALIHPYNDERVIAGQGTVAVELLDQVSPLDAIITPVGGGGLLSGTLTTAKSMQPQIKVYGAEPELADDAFRSLQTGKIAPVLRTDTIADGLRTALGDRTFPIIKEHCDGILLVSEVQIVEAMRIIFQLMKIVVEPSAAVALAGVLADRDRFTGQRVGLVLTGGNVDLGKLPF